MTEYYKYKRVMRQTKHDGPDSIMTVVCKPQQAEEMVGKLYRDNPSWEIVAMEKLEPFFLPNIATTNQGD